MATAASTRAGPETGRRPGLPQGLRNRDEAVGRALVFVSGLGHYELRLNGQVVADSFLAPGWTDYRKTCLYNTYDVTAMLKPGANAIGALSAPASSTSTGSATASWSSPTACPCSSSSSTSSMPRAGARRSSAVRTGGRPPAVTFSSIYGGEDYDARLEQADWDAAGFDDSAWKAALAVRGPQGRLEPERDWPLQVMAKIPVKAVKSPRPASLSMTSDRTPRESSASGSVAGADKRSPSRRESCWTIAASSTRPCRARPIGCPTPLRAKGSRRWTAALHLLRLPLRPGRRGRPRRDGRGRRTRPASWA